MLITSDSHYFIEPLKGYKIDPSKPHPHIIYKATLQDAAFNISHLMRPSQGDNSYCSNHAGIYS